MTTLAGFDLGSVTLGDLELLDGEDGAALIQALGSDSGYDLGNADPIEVALQTLLQEGAVVVTQGHNNREVVIPVLVKAGDPVALAEAEQRLFLQLERRNTLTMRYAEFDLSTVFEVVTSSLAQVTDDFAEVKRGERRYNIRLVCEPASRSESLVEVEVSSGGEPPESETAVVISEADNLTGWSTTAPHTLIDGDGFVAAKNQGGPSTLLPLKYTLPSPIPESTPVPYIYVEYRAVDLPNTTFPLALYINDRSGTLYPVMSVSAGEWIRAYYQTLNEAKSITSLEFAHVGSILSAGTPTGELRINRVVRTNMTPILGTTRQVTAAFPVLGSAPAQGSIRVRHPLNSLNTAVVYTRAATDAYYNPPQRGNLIAPKPAEANDGNTMSGKVSDPRDEHIFGIDAASLPEGTYDIWVRASSSAVEDVAYTWSAQFIPPNSSTPVGPTETGSHVHRTTGGYDIVCIGQVRLPTVLTRSGGGYVRLTFQQSSGGSSIYGFDELWLFEKQRGALTVVRAGTMRRLWLDSATLDRPRPTIYTLDRTTGSTSTGDTSDAVYPAGRVDAYGVHEFEPGLMFVFFASSVTGPAVGISYYPRWHTHAAL